MNGLKLRDVEKSDQDLIFNWRNLDELVSLSAHKRKVSKIEHQEWFTGALEDSLKILKIICYKGSDIGLIKSEKINSSCEISIYLIPIYQGKGMGKTSLKMFLDLYKTKCIVFTAKVQSNNHPSKKMFAALGFKIVEDKKSLLTFALE